MNQFGRCGYFEQFSARKQARTVRCHDSLHSNDDIDLRVCVSCLMPFQRVNMSETFSSYFCSKDILYLSVRGALSATICMYFELVWCYIKE